jgi:hypothetical protein
MVSLYGGKIFEKKPMTPCHAGSAPEREIICNYQVINGLCTYALKVNDLRKFNPFRAFILVRLGATGAMRGHLTPALSSTGEGESFSAGRELG